MGTTVASPSRIAPTSQTMDASSKALPPPVAAVVVATDDHLSKRHSRSSSASQIADSSSSISLRSEEYRQLFRLPPEEVLVQDFNCAFQENILLQGHMYLFDHYICFYSNIFGFETKKVIPFQDVTSVRRAKTAAIFPNAIVITAAGKNHFFGSFLSRDEAFKLIADGWSQNSGGCKELLDGQDSKSETSSQSNGFGSLENGISSDSPVIDRDYDERNLEVSRSGETNPSPSPNQVDDDDARPTSSEVPDIGNQDTVLVPDPSTSSQFVYWKEKDGDPPEIPENYTKVGESKFPISVEQFFSLFFSDDARSFVESYHKTCGDRDVTCTSWTPHDDFGYIREKSFQHPVKIYFGAKCSGCKETQKYQVYKNSHLVIETSQEVSDVPYADYFSVKSIWDVQKDGNESEDCILRVFVTVAFCKRTMWKGKIEQSTMEECRETYATWIQLAHELLKQNNIEKIKGNMVNSDQTVELNATQNGEHAEILHANADSRRNSETVTITCGNNEQTHSFLQGNVPQTSTVRSRITAFASKVSSLFKSQGNRNVILVIMFSIILLLMQLSIVVLLSRPQQVYVIPQADHISLVGHGSGQRAAEAMAWMEKRVHLLKDEMLVVEAQLERMRHEHIMLKTQMKDLEHQTAQKR